jgi:hypothetical protein
MRPRARAAWLFSAPVDVAVFGGSAALSLLLLWIGAAAGVLRDDTPDWAWVPAVLLVDVAHVWSTGVLVLDADERRRHGRLWLAIPLAGYAAGVLAYRAGGSALFWRGLAYLAVFHFVRQQWGWVALYRARAGETDRLGRLVDAAAIYLATLYPLAHWHAHLPRRFWWFVPGDFAAAPAVIERIAWPLYLVALAAYAARALAAAARGHANLGKDLVVVSTVACWYAGIVALDSDYAFTVTNVLIHGVPYVALVFLVARRRRVRALAGDWRAALAWVLGGLWALAFVEELFWDRAVWHDHVWLFGPGWSIDAALPYLVPLMALPQLTHYVLDGFLWRRRHRGDVISPLAAPTGT